MNEKEVQRAREKAMSFLDMRDHSAAELTKKLLRTFDEETAAAAVNELQRLGLCNDERFAESYMRSLRFRGKSTREIRLKLREKGVQRETVEAAFAETDASAEDAAACAALLAGKYAAKLRRGEGEKVAAALARRGFSYGVIRAALQEAEIEVAQNDEIDYTVEE